MGYSLTLPMTEEVWLELGGLPDESVPHRWVLGSGGYGAHCPDCLELDGEVRTLGEWQNSIMPGSGRLQCGSGCRCSLQSTLTMPTTFTVFLPYSPRQTLKRTLIFRDGDRQWRYNFTEVLYGNRLFILRPGRAPAASLPKALAAERRDPANKPLKTTTVIRPRRPVHGVD